MVVVLVILGVIAFLGLVYGIWYMTCYNNFIRLKNNAEEGFSTMDVCMKERYDLIPNFVETVKGYAKHEKETLNAVIEARSKAVSATTPFEKLHAEGDFERTIGKLLSITESYPELKANENFISLQESLKEIEGKISNSRRYYNACVKEYNIKVETFPSNIIARKKKFEKMPLFEIENKEERQNVKVKF